MVIEPDTLSFYKRSLRNLKIWRFVSITLFAVVLSIIFFDKDFFSDPISYKEYIAKFYIEGLITDNPHLENKLDKLSYDKNLKAVIVIIDSPGGTSFGGEFIFRKLDKLSSSGIPVVTIIRTIGTSAAYAVALGGDRIFALETSLIGSVGALIRSVDLTVLFERIGINPETYKSGKFKSIPSPTEKTSDEAKKMLNDSVNEVKNWFLTIIKEKRSISNDKLRDISSGGVYTGIQAKSLNLIDEIGGEPEAIQWLVKYKGINKNLAVIEIDKSPKNQRFWTSFFSFFKKFLNSSNVSLDGFMSVWHPID